MTKKIGIIVGSLRKGSLNRKVAGEMKGMFPEGYETDFIEIGDLPLYNEDLDGKEAPESYRTFREKAKGMDAFLFVTPEYNRSMSAAMKNALDVGSRPYGSSVWDGKPAAVVSVSQGAIGGFGANHHLRQTLVFLNMPTLQQPEAYLSNFGGSVNEAGEITKEETKQFLKTITDALVALVERY